MMSVPARTVGDMTLTMLGGPLSRKLPETRNFSITGPAHSLLMEPFGRRVRAEVDGVVVLDTVRGALLHETGLLPQLYAPEGDFRTDLLEPTATSTHCPFKGDASYRSIRVGDHVVTDAVWSYPEPLEGTPWLAGLAALPFSAADRWLDEDDAVTGHLTDPYHRVDLRHTTRPVTVTAADGTVVAKAEHSVLLAETGFENRFYLDADAVRAPIERTEATSTCPYRGDATWFSVRVGDTLLPDAAWSYETPHDEARAIAGLVCLAHDELTVAVG